jgi:sugar phosphate isomerase/epimerase
MQSAITVSLVPEARLGPFVFHAGLEDACLQAAELGFDAIEIFPPNAVELAQADVPTLLNRYGLKLAAVGTGAGWVREQLTLVSKDASLQARAIQFVKDLIDVAGSLGAPAIIGSMQGRAASPDERPATLDLLGQVLCPLADHARSAYQLPLLIEPLNRYETNLLNTLPDTAKWITGLPTDNLRILADLFHMNIEEANMASSIEAAGNLIGHVHFADSNRSAVGLGHAPIASCVQSLRKIGYSGYLSAEIFPKPDSAVAAKRTIESYRQLTAE